MKHWKTKTLIHWHTATQTHRHTDTQHYRQTQVALKWMKYILLYGKAKFWRKKLYTKTLFAPDVVLAMDVSEKLFERYFEGRFEPGHKSCTFNLKVGAIYAQKYLKKVHFDLKPSLDVF